MPEIDLGKIGASVVLNLEGLVSGVAQATGIITQLGTDMQANLGSALTGAGALITTFGVAVVGSLGAAVKVGGDFEQMMQQTAANTTMTTQDIAVMNDTVRKLGAESAAPLKQLAEGFMHASNFGYSAKDSAVILKEAMKSAVATGGDTGKTTELLAQVMHQFGMKTSEAAGAMNVLHLAAANGNMTLEQFVNSAGKSITTARNYGFSLVDVTSALSALTRNGFNAATASTQITGMMVKITNPSKSAKKALEELSQQTGVNLVRDFTVAGAAARGIPGVLDDIAEAAKRAHKPLAEVMNQAIPASRGGIGATALAGFARKDFDSIRADAQKAQSGKSDPTGESYAKSQQNLNNQLAQFHNQMTLLAADVQKALMPVLTPLLAWAREAIQWFTQLPDSVKQVAVVLTALAGAAALVAGPLLMMQGAVISMTAALALAGTTIGGVLTALAGAVAPVLAIVAAVALLVVAWKNDWGQIREHTQAFVSWISPYLSAAWNGIKSVAESGWNAIKDFISRIWPPIHDIIMFAWDGIVAGLRVGMEVLQGLFAGTWGNITAVLRGVWDLIAGVVKTAWALVAGIITVGLDLLTGRWSKAWQDFKHYAEMAWEGIKQAFSGLISGIVNIVIGAAKLLYNAGRDLVLGLINGIKSMASSAFNAARDLATGALNSAKSALGIQSPSKKFAEVGEYVAQGLAQGMEAGTGLVTNAATGLTAAAESALKRLKKVSDETRGAIKAAVDDIFRLTHTDFDVQKREAKQQYSEDRKSGVPEAVAKERVQLLLQKIAAEESKAAMDALGQSLEMLAKDDADFTGQVAKQAQAQDKATQSLWKQIAGYDTLGNAISKGMNGLQKAEQQAEQARAKTEKDAMKGLGEMLGGMAQAGREMTQAAQKASQEAMQKQQQQMQQFKATWGQLAQGSSQILESAFVNVLNGKFKNLFGNILQGFEQMITQMIAKWLAMQAIMGIFGAAGAPTGAFSSIFGGGFDVADNDNHAQRWGFDFARYFTGGMSDYGNKHKPMQGQAEGRGAGDTHVHVHIANVTNHTEADMGKMADMLAWKVQSGLSGRFVGSGR